MTEPMGPYDRSAEADREPMPTAWAAAVDAAQSGQRGQGGSVVYEHLIEACARYGIALGDWDRKVLMGLASREVASTQSVLGMLSRAYAAGQASTDQPATGVKPKLHLDRKGPRLTHGGIESSDGDYHGLSLPHADWDVLAATMARFNA